MDLSPEYDAPVPVRLVSAKATQLLSDVTTKAKVRDIAKQTLPSGDPSVQAALDAFIQAKATADALGDDAYVTINFPRITWPQIKTLGKKLKGNGVASIHARADETKLPQWERFRALQEHDRTGASIPDVRRYAMTDDGVDEVLAMAAQNANLSKEDAERVWNAIGPMGRAGLATELVSAAEPKIPTPPTTAPSRPNL
jgi:hypothetical protein